MTENTKKNIDYEIKTDKPEQLDPDTQNISNKFNKTLKFFSISIILFLLISYLSNNYIAGMGMNFIPLLIPIGKTFCPKPALGTLFHSHCPIPNSDKFFKETTLESLNQSQNIKYYELVNMGASFFNLIKGITGLCDLFLQGNIKEIDLTPIFLIDYQDTYWYQKIVLIIFGAIQILIGTATTIFSSLAYLFSGKHGILLNLPEEKKRLEKNQKYLFENQGISMVQSHTDQSLVKSGWTKFAIFFNFINFIFVDKLTYGTRYFVEDKHSSFLDRLKYLFLLIFILIITDQLKDIFISNSNSFIWTLIIIIIVFIFFSIKIINPLCSPSPLPNYEGLLQEIKYSATKNNSQNKDYTFNNLSNDITQLKDTLNKTIEEYSEHSKKLAKELHLNVVQSKPLSEQIKEKYQETKEKIKEKLQKFKTESKDDVETAQKEAEQNLAQQTGGSIKINPKYQKIIQELRKEIQENNL